MNNEYVIWGCGQRILRVLENFSGISKYIKIFVDSNKSGLMMGIPILNPKRFKYSGEIIVISSDLFYDEILMECKKREISSDKILSLNEWLFWCLSDAEVRLEPHSVRIESCTLCQLNCNTCYMRRNDYGTVGKGYLKAEDFEKFLEINKNIRVIEISNNGEVFLNPELMKILEIAYNHRVDITILNGANFNSISEEMIDALVKFGVKAMTISIDGASQGVYSLYRKNGDFKKVISNIKLINKYKRKHQSVIPILYWQYVLMKENECDLEAAAIMSEELGMESIYKLDWEGEYQPENLELVSKITKLDAYNRKEYEAKYGRKYTATICSQMIYQPQINWDGTLLGCCSNYMDKWNGNAFKESLSEILNDTIYRNSIRHAIIGKTTEELFEICQKCASGGMANEVPFLL